jgi:hypothetical protein
MTDRWKILAATLVSGVLMLALFWIAGLDLDYAKAIDWRWALAAVPAYVALVVIRAASLRSLAPDANKSSLACWVRLAGRHQALFSVAPAGVGDFGFPLLSSRYVRLRSADAVRIIAQYRLRDVVILGWAGIAAVLMQGVHPYLGVAVFFAGVPLFLYTDDVAVLILSGLRRISGAGRVTAFLEEAIPPVRPALRERIGRSAWAMSAWVMACMAMYLVFWAVGAPLSVAGVLMVILALNVAGAVAISIAGFGVAEAGVAGALIALGMTVPEATTVALVARPLLLASMLTGCLVADLVATPLVRRSPPGVARP